jgi:hypothetical protein
MEDKSKHEHFCFAGQLASCQGYFPNEVLPCVCGADGNVIRALSQVAVRAPPGGTPAPAAWRLSQGVRKPRPCASRSPACRTSSA